jgi:hypothetical protein
MKIKPVVQENLHTIHTSYEVDFAFENNITPKLFTAMPLKWLKAT